MVEQPVTLAGARLAARASGALWWPDERLLCVADLHLGKSERLARRGGALLPPYETAETLDRLAAEIAALAPARVVCLGDSFDDSAAGAALAPDQAARLYALAAGREWIWIAGNHDPAPGSHVSTSSAPDRSPSATSPVRTLPPARSPATTTPSSACRCAAEPSPAPASSPTPPASSCPPSAPTPAASSPPLPRSPASSPPAPAPSSPATPASPFPCPQPQPRAALDAPSAPTPHPPPLPHAPTAPSIAAIAPRPDEGVPHPSGPLAQSRDARRTPRRLRARFTPVTAPRIGAIAPQPDEGVPTPLAHLSAQPRDARRIRADAGVRYPHLNAPRIPASSAEMPHQGHVHVFFVHGFCMRCAWVVHATFRRNSRPSRAVLPILASPPGPPSTDLAPAPKRPGYLPETSPGHSRAPRPAATPLPGPTGGAHGARACRNRHRALRRSGRDRRPQPAHPQPRLRRARRPRPPAHRRRAGRRRGRADGGASISRRRSPSSPSRPSPSASACSAAATRSSSRPAPSGSEPQRSAPTS